MNYLGGKTRLSSKIANTISEHKAARETYLEPFVGGGAALTKIAPMFRKVYASDISLPLIVLYQQLQNGWEPPDTLTEEEYKHLKHDASDLALQAFAGFGCSFGGKWFGGYSKNSRGDDYCGGAKRSLAKTSRATRHVTFVHNSYKNWACSGNEVVYCDPPYAGTTGYRFDFNHDEFWAWAARQAKTGAVVFVSEYEAPAFCDELWAVEHNVQTKRDDNKKRSKERLFLVKG